MAGHGDGGEEVTGAPLHIDALQGIGVVAHPELVEEGQYAPVGTTTAAGTCLDGDIRELVAYPLAHFHESTMVVDI